MRLQMARLVLAASAVAQPVSVQPANGARQTYELAD